MARPVRHRQKWRIRWIDGTGRRRSEVHETFNAAQRALRLHEAEAIEMKRGLRPAEPESVHFHQLCDHWPSHRAPQKRSGRDDKYIIESNLRPAFGALLLDEITADEIDRYAIDRSHLAPQTTRNHLTLLGTMLRLAADRAVPWLRRMPKIRKPKAHRCSTEYRWLRTFEELRRFLDAAKCESDLVHALFATACYSGARAGELATLLWSDIDFDGRLITISKGRLGPTKSGRVRYVPILDPLLPILRRWRLKCRTDLVFPNRAGHVHGPSARIFHETLRRVLDRADFPRVMIGKKLRPYVNFHGLRHSFASLWVLGEGDIFRLQKILGHSDISLTTERYSHLAPSAFRTDYERLGGGPSEAANVVQLFGESF